MHFFEYCSSRGFNAVNFPDGEDVIALYSFLVHGRDPFDVIEVNAFCVNDELFSFNSNVDCWYVFGAFDGGF